MSDHEVGAAAGETSSAVDSFAVMLSSTYLWVSMILARRWSGPAQLIGTSGLLSWSTGGRIDLVACDGTATMTKNDARPRRYEGRRYDA